MCNGKIVDEIRSIPADRWEKIWYRLTEPAAAVQGAAPRRRARLLSSLLITFMPISTAAVAGRMLTDPNFAASTFGVPAAAILVYTLSYILSRTRYYFWSAIVAVGTIFVAVFAAVFIDPRPIAVGVTLNFLATFVLLGSMFFSTVVTIGLVILSAASTLFLPVLLPELTGGPVFTSLSFLAVMSGLIIVASEIRRRDLQHIEQQSRQLAESETRYRRLVENAPIGILSFDAQGKITSVNSWLVSLLGSPSAEATQEINVLAFPPLVEAGVAGDFGRCLESGELSTYERAYNTKWGKEVHWRYHLTPIREAQGAVVGAQAILEDITERMKAEKALHRASERLQTLHEIDQAILTAQSPETIAQVAAEHLRDLLDCQRVSLAVFDLGEGTARVFASSTGSSTQLGAGQNLPLKAFDLEQLESDRMKVVETIDQIAQPTQTDRMLQKEGIQAYVSIPLTAAGELVGSLNLGRAEAGGFSEESLEVAQEVAGSLAVAIQQARLHEQVQQHADELSEQAQELRRSNTELQQFAYVASHDLQEPLRMVTSYLQLLERRYGGELDSDADEFIAYAVDGAKRMHELINGLLAYSRVGTHGTPFEATDSRVILDSVLSNLQVALGESNTQVSYGQLPTIWADGVQLAQLFQNLISNAIKFQGEQAPEIRVEAKRQGDRWRFSVRDNGIGIEPAYAKRIFLIFQRLHTRDEYPGTGIGLAICKRIVERHGGRIWVESKPGEGSTFCFTMPEAAVLS